MADSTAPLKHIRKLLIANRGEIAVRAIKACRELGVKSIAVLTHTDATSLHATLADEAVVLPGDDSSAYTDGNAILDICKQTDADAIFPGYGFLSENTEFADAAAAAGITFVGPSAASILAMGLKHEARALAQNAGVPVIPGTSLLQSQEDAVSKATQLGFPVMLKATGGGGGMGMQICADAQEVANAWSNVQSRAATLFKNNGVFMERYFPRARHVEIQVAGNGDGTVVAFGERECSLQRRHQKVVEETPSPFVMAHPGLRERMITAAVAYATQLRYKSVGTVEFLVDDDTADFFFLEMNTRLQVEHGISELRYGVDLVHLMLRQADFERGGAVGLPADELKSLVRVPSPDDCAIEVRVYAEAPLRDFAPTPGLLQNVIWPKDDGKNVAGVRVDTWVQSGQRISPLYDPLVSKIMVFSPNGREDARRRMLAALSATKLQGTQTNLEYLSALIDSDIFASGATLTSSLGSFSYESCSVQVIDPGVATTVQDHPGRTSIGHGIPPGGPMDDMSARIANLLAGNEPGMEHLEILLSGPELLFHSNAVVSVCGAALDVTVDGSLQPMWSRIVISKGQTLKLGRIGKSATNGGLRAYLAIKGGFPEVALFLGSKATAPELGFGGVQGRKLQRHDTLTLHPIDTSSISPITLPEAAIPKLEEEGPVTIHCMDGPYNSDDILTPDGRKTLCSSSWTVGRDSGRSGVRLGGPQLAWARESGGGGGAHPSNVFDYGYPHGGVNFTGEAPIIFAKDCPDLGGFVCPITVCLGSMWKVGQLRPGDSVKFNTISYDEAVALQRAQASFLADVQAWVSGDVTKSPVAATALQVPTVAVDTIDWTKSAAILHQTPAVDNADGTRLHPKVTYRQGGDTSIMVEYGDQTADLRGTACVHRLAQQLSEAVSSGRLQGVRGEPNFGSLTVRFNALLTDRADLLAQLIAFDASIQSAAGSEVSIQAQTRMPTRRIRLPVCLDHKSLSESAQRYMDSIRPTAAYLPDNVAYLAENNALKSRDSVFDALLKTPWIVVAVGFYVGTPILFPLDPWRVLVGQKYSPSRVYTPGGTVGLGGSLLAVYPVDAPGGYQMMGRTLGGWDASGSRPGFTPDRPWLFTPLDVVEFYEVPEPEFDRIWRDYESGRYNFNISAEAGETLDLGAYIATFEAAARDPAYQEWRRTQAAAAAAVSEREQKLFDEWTAEKQAKALENGGNTTAAIGDDDDEDDATAIRIESPMDANVWKVLVKPGDVLVKGQTVAILEAMKMEINIIVEDAHVGAVITKISQPPGSIVSPGSVIIRANKV